jgi:hypothetical protein
MRFVGRWGWLLSVFLIGGSIGDLPCSDVWKILLGMVLLQLSAGWVEPPAPESDALGTCSDRHVHRGQDGVVTLFCARQRHGDDVDHENHGVTW